MVTVFELQPGLLKEVRCKIQGPKVKFLNLFIYLLIFFQREKNDKIERQKY